MRIFYIYLVSRGLLYVGVYWDKTRLDAHYQAHSNVGEIKMFEQIFKVVSQGTVSYIPSTKQEGGQLAKCEIRLKRLGGSKFGDEFVATLFGNLAQCRFYEGDVVVVVLRFSVHEVNGCLYQDVVCNDIIKLNR